MCILVSTGPLEKDIILLFPNLPYVCVMLMLTGSGIWPSNIIFIVCTLIFSGRPTDISLDLQYVMEDFFRSDHYR